MTTVSFEGRLDDAAIAQAYVSSRFNRMGLWTLTGPIRSAESFGEFKEYAGSVDIAVSTKSPADNHKCRVSGVQVKSRKIQFDGPDDYPFESAILDSADNTDSTATTSPQSFVLVSPTRGLSCVRYGTCLYRSKAYDRYRKHGHMAWFCDKRDLCTFEELCEFIIHGLS